MRRQRKSKIVATLGPSSSDKNMIETLFRAGVDVFRLNFSHGEHEEHKARVSFIRELENTHQRPIGIIQDLQGPKIRLGTLRDGAMDLETGQVINFVLSKSSVEANTLPLPHPEAFEALLPGHRLLIDDGKVQTSVVGIEGNCIRAEVITGGQVSDRKGVNLPMSQVPISSLTEKDRIDLEFGCNLGVDYTALSFVQKPSDIIEARGLIGDRTAIITKIEKPQAFEKIDNIIALSDAVMVARGDLGVELPPEEVPGRQKELVRACRLAGKPVIVATQMLDSMVSAPTPTRAEASDVATAIYDGADAVMLSAESAAGDFPKDAVAMMDRIITQTENHSAYRSIIGALQPAIDPTAQHAVSSAAAAVAQNIEAKAIVAFTSSGTTACRIARERPIVPVVSLTPDIAVARRLTLLWGVHSVVTVGVADYYSMVTAAGHHAVQEEFAKAHERIVVVSGEPFGIVGSTNNLRIFDIGEI